MVGEKVKIYLFPRFPGHQSVEVFSDYIRLNIDWITSLFPRKNGVQGSMGNNSNTKAVSLNFVDGQADTIYRNRTFFYEVAGAFAGTGDRYLLGTSFLDYRGNGSHFIDVPGNQMPTQTITDSERPF